MANLAFMHPRLSDAATITASSAEANMPVTNLQKKQPGDVWRPTDLTPYVSIDLGSGYAASDISIISMIAINATATATWRVRAANVAGDITTSPGYDSGSVTMRPAGSTAYDPYYHAIIRKPDTSTSLTQLFDGQTSGGGSTAYDWPGGEGAFWASGTFDGCTVKLQSSADGGTTWIDVGAGTTFTSADVAYFTLSACKIRAYLSGPGVSTSIDSYYGLSTASPYRYWRIDIDDSDNTDGYIDLGRLYLSAATILSINAEYGLQRGFSDRSRKQRSVGGQRYSTRRPPEAIWTGSIDFGTEAEMLGDMLELDLTRGTARDIMACLDYEEDTYLAQGLIYGEFQSLQPVVNTVFNRFSKRFIIEQLLP